MSSLFVRKKSCLVNISKTIYMINGNRSTCLLFISEARAPQNIHKETSVYRNKWFLNWLHISICKRYNLRRYLIQVWFPDIINNFARLFVFWCEIWKIWLWWCIYFNNCNYRIISHIIDKMVVQLIILLWDLPGSLPSSSLTKPAELIPTA